MCIGYQLDPAGGCDEKSCGCAIICTTLAAPGISSWVEGLEGKAQAWPSEAPAWSSGFSCTIFYVFLGNYFFLSLAQCLSHKMRDWDHTVSTVPWSSMFLLF